jgi:hypothetical protein
MADNRDERLTKGCSQNGSKQRKPGWEVYVEVGAINSCLALTGINIRFIKPTSDTADLPGRGFQH